VRAGGEKVAGGAAAAWAGGTAGTGRNLAGMTRSAVPATSFGNRACWTGGLLGSAGPPGTAFNTANRAISIIRYGSSSSLVSKSCFTRGDRGGGATALVVVLVVVVVVVGGLVVRLVVRLVVVVVVVVGVVRAVTGLLCGQRAIELRVGVGVRKAWTP